ncbi:MAG TPA: helix-turn-helix domain-containing protein [Anaerolineaceae bacterium]|jgi:AcrR family transcriptional regulator|nr:helix-turn-helix domain-containing protein [Anaerolineaceae bacterium]
MTPRSSRIESKATRSRVMEAAFQLFLEQGYHGTALRQIVARAGVTMGGIYNHFASKEELWVAVFLGRHPLNQLAPLMQQVEGETITAAVHSAARLMVAELGRQDELVKLMMIEVVEFNGRHMPMLMDLVLPAFMETGQVIFAKTGRLRPLPMPILIRAFVGLFFSYYMTDKMIPPQFQSVFGSDSLSNFVDVYLHGILVSSEEASKEPA